MGFYKELQIKLDNEGIDCDSYFRIGGKKVCHRCFDDYAIQAFIQDNAKSTSCDYCRKSSKKNISISLYEVVKFIIEGIRYEWDLPVNCMGWCSQEGGWIGADVIGKVELLEKLFLDINEDLLQDIKDLIANTRYCQKDPYSLRPEEDMYYNWKEFSEIIKHQVRYFFLKVGKTNLLYEEKKPYQILYNIGKAIKELGLIKTLPRGKKIFRARISPNKLKAVVEELGPPPRDKAIQSNRMSPAGIPMFYGSMDEKTAIAEICDKKDRSNKYITVATFKTLKKLTVIDLTDLPELPSLFDKEKRHLRTPLKFLRSFLLDFSKPIKKDDDDREHIEYVPTQVVTEYFRHVFRQGPKKIEGIIYQSAQKRNGKSCVLFCDSEKCIQDNKVKTDENSDKWLMMISSSVKIRTVNQAV